MTMHTWHFCNVHTGNAEILANYPLPENCVVSCCEAARTRVQSRLVLFLQARQPFPMKADAPADGCSLASFIG
jgi:hypothetical protein